MHGRLEWDVSTSVGEEGKKGLKWVGIRTVQPESLDGGTV